MLAKSKHEFAGVVGFVGVGCVSDVFTSLGILYTEVLVTYLLLNP